MTEDNKQCTHDRLEFMSQLIYGDPHYTKYWSQCVFCGAKLYEREQFHDKSRINLGH
jgi:hypothetical protein